jgi:hypothetical protein
MKGLSATVSDISIRFEVDLAKKWSTDIRRQPAIFLPSILPYSFTQPVPWRLILVPAEGRAAVSSSTSPQSQI